MSISKFKRIQTGLFYYFILSCIYLNWIVPDLFWSFATIFFFDVYVWDTGFTRNHGPSYCPLTLLCSFTTKFSALRFALLNRYRSLSRSPPHLVCLDSFSRDCSLTTIILWKLVKTTCEFTDSENTTFDFNILR